MNNIILLDLPVGDQCSHFYDVWRCQDSILLQLRCISTIIPFIMKSEKKVYTVMVINSANANKSNKHFSS